MNTCPNAEKCPIFNGILKDKLITAKGYRSQFCDAGVAAYSTCKRYQAKNTFGACPPDLLPNSFMTLEQIAAKYNLVATK